MKKFSSLTLLICLGLFGVNNGSKPEYFDMSLGNMPVSASPLPTDQDEIQPFYLDERNVLREKKNAESARDVTDEPKTEPKDAGTFDENTPKFKYEPLKEGEEPNEIQKLEEGLTPVNTTGDTSEEVETPTKVINNTNTRFKGHKELKRKERKDLLDILPEDVNREMPNNGMTTPEQKHYSQNDYEQAYRDMQVPTFSFVHGIDPDQYYDMKDAAWSPYPLFRLNSPLYFKTIVIEPGYYLLTPRQYKNKWYILFKEAGTVKYIIPVFNQCYAEAGYYHTHLKELDMSRSARWQIKFLNSWGKYIRRSKRKPAIQTNLELTDLDNNFLLIDLYYGPYKYSAIFRTEKF